MSSISGTLYIGITNDIDRRVWEHKQGLIEGFSKIYKCTRLVYYECFDDVRQAISREKQLKKWRREKKIGLIEGVNPRCQDLSENWGSRMIFPQESIKQYREKAAGGDQEGHILGVLPTPEIQNRNFWGPRLRLALQSQAPGALRSG